MIKNTVFENYKDKHKGQRAFMIANGPSLSETKLDLLKNEVTFAMNRVPLIYEQHKEFKRKGVDIISD